MPSFLADYRDLPHSTRIVTAILLPILLLAGVIGGSSATTYVAAIGERCTLDLPIGTIVELDIPGIFAQRIARNKWELSSDFIVDNCYVKEHMKHTKQDCEPQDRACQLTFSSIGRIVKTDDGQTWTKTGINEWQNASGDIRNNAAMFEQSTTTKHTAAGIGGVPKCKKEPPPPKFCSSSSAPKERATHSSSSSSSAPTCTAVHYKFDEGAGTTTLNALGSSHVGSLVNSPVWSTDHAPTLFQNSGALAFDGSNKVTIPTLPTPDTPYTISFWIKAPMTENADQMILQWAGYSWKFAIGHRTFTRYDCQQNGTVYQFNRTYDPYFQGSLCTGQHGTATNVRNYANYYFNVGASANYYSFNEDAQMPHATWVHLTFVNDGEPNAYPSTKRLYINGVDNGDPNGGLTGGTQTGLTIGNLHDEAIWPNLSTPSIQYINYNTDQTPARYWYPAQGFNGLIDDVRVYNRILSASEVAALATGADVSFDCTR